VAGLLSQNVNSRKHRVNTCTLEGFVRETSWVSADVSVPASTAPVNIAMVSAQASPLLAMDREDAGEQRVHVAGLSAALARRGHRVTVYTRRDHPDLPETVGTPQGYQVVHVPAGPPEPVTDDELLRAMGPFAQYLAARWAVGDTDLIHAHFWMSGLAAELVARQLHLPTVLSFHGVGTAGVRIRLESKLAKAATSVSAACTDEAFELIRMGRPRAGVSVIPCGVDTDVFAPAGPQAPRGQTHRIVGMGKFLPRNGFDTVVRAMPLIPDAEFVVIGEPDSGDLQRDSEASRLRLIAEQLGVADRLRPHGAVTLADLPALLRSADVVVCTPSYESSGIVALEAMACGIPVVASAVGPLSDIVVHGVTGYVVDRQDPRRVATALNALLRDSFLRRSLGAAGRDRITARYTWDRIAADTVRLYAKSMSASTGGPPTAASV
jgi:D-inositol-3-phosphate glycosyltransferase